MPRRSYRPCGQHKPEGDIMANVGKPEGRIGFPPEVRCTLANSQAQRCARAMRLGEKPPVPANSCAE